MDSNNLNLEVEFVDKTRFEIEYKDLSIINGKSIKKVEPVSESTESGGVSIYKIFREYTNNKLISKNISLDDLSHISDSKE